MIHLNIAKGLKRQLASLTGPIFIETLLIMTLGNAVGGVIIPLGRKFGEKIG